MGEFEGVINNLERRYAETTSVYSKADIEAYMSDENVLPARVNVLKRKVFR